jgi:hypothetical protein
MDLRQNILCSLKGLDAPNPYFANLPLMAQKESFYYRRKELNLDVIVNTSVFILPLGNNLFKVGATYNWRQDKFTHRGW